MIPLRDDVPSVRVPWVTWSLIAANGLAFFYELSLGPALDRFLLAFGVVPARFLYFFDYPEITLASLAVPLFMSLFLHGGWMHLIGNMWFLFIFGDNVEDRLGHGRYLLFYLGCGLAASGVHILFNLESRLPTIGASGAISGVLAAYVLFHPHGRILTLLPIFIFFQLVEIPALIWVGLWFLMQLAGGLLSGSPAGGVAWGAHVGGFLFGLLVMFRSGRRGRRHGGGAF
jgi:membrane associated rhomboid family serine protease